METLTLNDGTVLAGYCSEGTGKLFVYLYNQTLASAYVYLSDSEKTKKIMEHNYDAQYTYTGYNHLYCISEERGGEVSAILTKQ